MAPLHAQKMILFILQRGNEIFDLNNSGLLIMSLECFIRITVCHKYLRIVLYISQYNIRDIFYYYS